MKMRKLWPPTFDKFSRRFWACFGSVGLNIFFVLVLRFGSPDVATWFFAPGLVPILITTGGWFVSLTVFGNVILLLTNLVFYYFAVSWAIAVFKPATNWWPAKHFLEEK